MSTLPKRSFVPSTYPQSWKDAAKSKYQPFEQLSPEKLASIFAYTEDKTKNLPESKSVIENW